MDEVDLHQIRIGSIDKRVDITCEFEECDQIGM